MSDYDRDNPDWDTPEQPADESADRQNAITEYERLLDRLGNLAQTFGTARDLRTIYRALYDFALASTPCNSIAISLVERGFRTAVYACCASEEIDLSAVPSIRIAGESPHTTALLNNRIVILDDLQAAMSKRTLVPIGFDIDPSQPQSSLIAPMSVMGRIVGSFEIQSEQRAAFKPAHATAMRMAANLAAVAIENVRLFEREREREEQLRQSQKMEAIGRLAGGVAHDFNNLLTAIIGYSQLISARLRRDDPLRVDVKEIEKAGNRAASLTSQLLAFSRKQVLQPKVLDLNAVIFDLEKLLSRLIGEDIELVTACDSALGKVTADPGQIEQVLMNLVVNSRDAMPRGGKLLIQTANIEIDPARSPQYEGDLRPGSYVMFAVSDTGCGMNKETISHIFEPFFTTKEQGKGTGLGLSTVYGIVSQSGGEIVVESELDRGTRFTVYLPRTDGPVDSVKVAESELVTHSLSETVLLVEDEQVVSRLVLSILEMTGYHVLLASTGKDAVQICAEHEGPIHLMITDVVMPQMSGRELAERVAALRRDIKVLYMSGYTDDSIMQHGVARTEIDFLQKPFTPTQLLAKVRSILEGRGRDEQQSQDLRANQSEDSLSRLPDQNSTDLIN